MRRGGICWYEPPDDKARPFLLLTRDSVLPSLERLMAAPTTRRLRGIPTEVELDEADGMPQRCALSLDNVQLIHRTFCTHRITSLGPERLDQVCRALHIAVDC